jgi:hypothetical protein
LSAPELTGGAPAMSETFPLVWGSGSLVTPYLVPWHPTAAEVRINPKTSRLANMILFIFIILS